MSSSGLMPLLIWYWESTLVPLHSTRSSLELRPALPLTVTIHSPFVSVFLAAGISRRTLRPRQTHRKPQSRRKPQTRRKPWPASCQHAESFHFPATNQHSARCHASQSKQTHVARANFCGWPSGHGVRDGGTAGGWPAFP